MDSTNSVMEIDISDDDYQSCDINGLPEMECDMHDLTEVECEQLKTMMEETKEKEEKGRTYQIALLELAKEENIIVCLPTGAGKTYIAVELTKHYLKDAKERNKKIVFIANTVPLVHQQTAYFKERIGLSFGNNSKSHIREITGEMNVDIWKEPQWNREMAQAEIFVMTSEILKEALYHAFIPFSKLNLLILDECHHAAKGDPMAKIMEKYESIRSEKPEYELPRVMGLTATIINGNSTVSEIPSEVKDMEKRLCCKAVTYRDYEEVLRHSTKANIQYAKYAKSLECEGVTQIVSYLDTQIAYINNFKNIVVDSRQEIVNQVDHSTLRYPGQMFNARKKPLEELTKALKDVKKICTDLGPYGARLAASIKIAYLKLTDEEDELRKNLRIGAATALSAVLNYTNVLMSNQSKSDRIHNFVTEKVKELFKVFLGWKQLKGDEELCSIVFCTERLTAQILSWIFQDLIEHCVDFNFIKSAFVVGCSRGQNDLVEQRITIKKQEDVIQKFHDKKVNLVFATNVLEEGLNVPACSLIIRFDPFNRYPSFVQSMGRARKKDAIFCILTSEEDSRKTQDTIDKYFYYSTALANHLKNEARHLDVDDENIPTTTDDPDELSPLAIDPTDPDSPKITLTEAVSLVYRYCQTLLCDKLVVLEPYSWVAKVIAGENEGQFKGYILLPSNALVREVTEGIARDSKNSAKRVAYLELCKKLYAKGAFSDKLLPLRRSIPPKIKAWLDNVDEEKCINGKKVGTRKRTQWYSKKIPGVLIKRAVTADVALNIFRIRIQLVKPTTDSEDHIQLFQFQNKRHAFAILTELNLSEIPAIHLESHYAAFTSKYVDVKLKSSPVFNQKQILKIKDFQNLIFTKTLKMEHSVLKNTESNPFLIVALIHDTNDEWDINWSLMNELKDVDESNYREIVAEEERRKLSFPAENYEDAVIIPWHNTQQTKLSLNCVLQVRHDLTRDSPMGKNNLRSFESYYSEEYKQNIVCAGQPYLQCTPLGSQLNFLSKKKDDSKKEKAAEKGNRELPILIPEFCRIYPMSASLLAQVRFLPSILHRTDRLLLSGEIHRSVANYFNWEAALNWKECAESDFYQRECPSPAKIPRRELAEPNEYPSPQSSSSIDFNSPEMQKRLKECKLRDYKEKVHLDWIHPDKISVPNILDHKKWQKKNRKKVSRRKQYSKINGNSKVKVNPEVEVDSDVELSSEEQECQLINMDDIKFPSLDTRTNFWESAGPSPLVIMEALTVANANDCFNLENLEVIGDSFLKYAVSTLLYCEFPNEDEGVMTLLRNKLVSNSHLYRFGTRKKLGEFVSGGIFNPKFTFLPPGFTVPEIASTVTAKCDTNYDVYTQSWDAIEQMSEDQLEEWVETNKKNVSVNVPSHTTYTHTRLGDKNIADSVEALIGAYYMHGGTDAAFRFMEWLELQFPTSDEKFIKYGRCTPPLPNRYDELAAKLKKTPDKVLPLIEELESLIGYKFNDRWLVVEAFSHPGYLKNGVTDCYQRLEFLGDAVLDFLVTNHIYRNKLANNPGEMTDLRSALVNNVTFGSLVVKYGFQKYLLSVCKQLQDVIDTFVTHQKQNGNPMTGHFKLLNDLECQVADEIDVPKVLGDIWESLAGAVFLDCKMSLDTTWKVFYRLMKNEIDEFSENTPKSPIRELYERFPSLKFITFRSNNEEQTTPQGWQVVGVKLKGKMYCGCGTNNKQARQAAAKYALSRLSTTT